MSFTKKKLAIFISIFLVLLSGLLSKEYRLYIYEKNIYDYHFADTLTDWFAVPAASLFFWGIQRKYSFPKLIAVSVVSFVIFEFFFSITFDYYDVIAVLLSGGVTYLIYLILKKCI
jgi:hypothetical protein